MSCTGCSQPFGFLKREVACPQCGFSYCKKCLRFKLVLDPETSKKEVLVCRRCHSKLSTGVDMEQPPAMTKALITRLESLENPSRPPITVYRQPAREARLAQLKRGLSIEDQQLADRLESLRKNDHPRQANGHHHGGSGGGGGGTTSEEIEARLARLKGEDPSHKPSTATPLSTISQNVVAESENDIIMSCAEQVRLDQRYNEGLKRSVDDMEARLERLRGGDPGKQQQQHSSSSSASTSTTANTKQTFFEDEDLTEAEQVARIIERFKAEVELENKNKNESEETSVPADVNMTSDDVEDDDDDDVDNLCRICEEKRATLKCDECDGDLFCKKCCDEFHYELGEVHKYVPVVVKK